MATTNNEIEIDATPDQAWAVLRDPCTYSEWSAMFLDLNGEAKVGGKISGQFKMPDGRLQTINLTMLKVDEPTNVEWAGGVPMLLKAVHGFKIEDLGGGRCRVTNYESFGGLIAPLLGKMVRALGAAYAAENVRLKAHIESRK